MPARAQPRSGTRRCYIVLHKPYDVLSQFTAELPGQRTLTEFGLPADVYAAGRLDRDSEGLLLLTNDGPLIKRLLDPKHGHERTYLAQVEGIPSSGALDALRSGVVIEGRKTLPAAARLVARPSIPEREVPIRVRKNIPVSWIEIKLKEGKNRQVRKMTAAVGHPTLRLIRIAIGPLELEDLKPGEWRELSAEKIKGLKDTL